MSNQYTGRPRPTPQQLAWQDMELGMFFHFDIPVFTDLGEREWRKAGRLRCELFNPRRLDTDQWLEAARAMGARYAVLVAKHGSGFLMWQSDLYPYGVRQSPWRGGRGDIVGDFVASCHRYGVKPGIYCNVTANAYWEVSHPGLVRWGKGGDAARQAAYARLCQQMLAELWGSYGPLVEVWFDGGALPPEQGGPDLVPLLRRLQPEAVVFQGPAASLRWVGNETGAAPYPCWATVTRPDEPDLLKLGHGDPDGSLWLPAECDVPIRNHDWFWHPDCEHKLYSIEQLMDMYEKSVGRNCNLLLNANIDRDGLVPEPDMRRTVEFGREVRRRFGQPVAETAGRGAQAELPLPRPTAVDRVVLMEQISEGERVREYVVEGMAGGRWGRLCAGLSIGHKRIERFEAATVTKLRMRCARFVAEPVIRRFAAYGADKQGIEGL